MNRDDTDRLFQVIEAALKLPEAERIQFVIDEVGDTSGLATQALKMLSAESRMGEFLETPARESMELLEAIQEASGAPPEIPGAIGKYRVDSLIGHGGMGNVYLATQQLDSVSRKVAIKVIRRGMDSDHMVNRFRAERNILAGLHHHNVARLIDVGTTDTGQAFLVMEYVDGIPINKYCDEHRLTIDERLALFDDVFAAVQYCHQNLIVHRDIKPSNILVTGTGHVKLLDFGIAKLIDAGSQKDSAPVTTAEQRFVTLEYSAPELLLGQSISTAADVYSLGALLYQLLTGSRPFSRGEESRAELINRICSEDCRAPSRMFQEYCADEQEQVATNRRSTPRQMVADLTGDMETIVLKALRRDPAERYSSVGQFQEDVIRYRNHDTISARPATVLYRLKKAYARHRTGVAVGLGVLFLLVTITAVYITSLSQQTKAAKEAAQRAEDITEFVVGLFKTGAGTSSNDEQVSAALTLLGPALDNLDDLGTNEESRVALLNVVGEVLRTSAQRDRAMEVLQAAYERIDHPEVSDLTKARTLLELARTHKSAVQHDSAFYYAGLALSRFSDISGPDDEWALESEKYRAWSAPDSIRDSLVDEVVSHYEDVYGPESVELAALLNDLGQGRPYAAEFFERALAIWRDAHGLDDPLVATSMANLSLAIEKVDSSRALELQHEATEMFSRHLGESHPRTLQTLSNIGAMYVERKVYGAADSIFSMTKTRRRALTQNSEDILRPVEDYWHARALRGLNRPAEAADLLEVNLKNMSVDDYRYPTLLLEFLTCLVEDGRVDYARSYLTNISSEIDSLVSDNLMEAYRSVVGLAQG